MGTLYVFVIFVTLSSHCSAYFVSHSEIDRSTTSVLLKEGQSAEISCMTRGTGDFFWRKGETLYNSILVASFTVGDVSDDSQPYSVTVNGTLHVKSVTLKDEGNYFCRVSSTESECYGEVKILVQASLRNFDLAIDRCDRESSCLLYLDPSQFTSLTCTALNASPLMTLKWFNGSKEIIEGIQQNEILTQNGTSRDITSTVVAVYGHPASLTCQAVDPKRSNDDVRFAHAQVEMKVPVHETLPSWIIVAVTLAGCFIVFVIFLLIKARANRKKAREIKERKEEFSLLSEEKDEEITKLKVEKDREVTELKVEKDREVTELKVEKDREITELKGKLSQTEEELKKKREDAHQFEVNEHVKDTDLRNIRDELQELKDNLAKKERELKCAKEKKVPLVFLG